MLCISLAARDHTSLCRGCNLFMLFIFINILLSHCLLTLRHEVALCRNRLFIVVKVLLYCCLLACYVFLILNYFDVLMMVDEVFRQDLAARFAAATTTSIAAKVSAGYYAKDNNKQNGANVKDIRSRDGPLCNVFEQIGIIP